jgi:porin
LARLLWETAVCLGLLVAPGTSAEQVSRSDWLERSHLAGDWGGRRSSLAGRGVELGATYTTGFWSNLDGGFRTGSRYEGFAEWFVEADLDALFGWQGGRFEIDWYSYHGGQPSEDLVGSFATQTVSDNETSRSVRFFEILLRQTLFDDRVVFKVGQLSADDDFFVAENADALLNGTFGFLGLGRPEQIAPFFPLAAPGAYFMARTADRTWEVHAGVYTEDPGRDERSNFGFGWSFDNGAFLLGEIRSNRNPLGRAGSYALGAAGSTADVRNFQSGGRANGTYGLYGLIDQLLFERTSARPGLGVFLRSYGMPQEERNEMLWYVGAGLKLTRPLPGRDKDVLSLGFAHLRFSDDYVDAKRASGENVSEHDSVLELTYRFQATGWLTLQPDVQLFFDPHLSRRDATVIGLRAVVDL